MKHVSIHAALAATLVALGGTTDARAQDTVRTSRTQPNQAMLGSGIVTLGVPYVASVVVAASSDHPGDQNLYIPVAGPWLDLAERHCAGSSRCDDGLNKGLLAVNGIFQGLGALSILSAFAFPETVTTTSAKTRRAPIAKLQMGPAPISTGYGVAAIGAF